MISGVFVNPRKTWEEKCKHNRNVEKSIENFKNTCIFQNIGNYCYSDKYGGYYLNDTFYRIEIYFGMLIKIQKIKYKNSVEIIEKNLDQKAENRSKDFRIFRSDESSNKIFETLINRIISA